MAAELKPAEEEDFKATVRGLQVQFDPRYA